MGYARKDVEKTKKIAKKFVRYQEGAELYSIGLTKFQELAKEAKASVLIPPHSHYNFRMTRSQSLFFVLPRFSSVPYAIRNVSRSITLMFKMPLSSYQRFPISFLTTILGKPFLLS